MKVSELSKTDFVDLCRCFKLQLERGFRENNALRQEIFLKTAPRKGLNDTLILQFLWPKRASVELNKLLSTTVEFELQKVRQDIADFEKDGSDRVMATYHALIGSVFHDHCSIYFLCSGEEFSEDTAKRLQQALEKTDKKAKGTLDRAEKVGQQNVQPKQDSNLEQQIQSLGSLLREARDDLKRKEQELETRNEEIRELKQQLVGAENAVAARKKRFDGLQSEHEALKAQLRKLQQLNRHEDNPPATPKEYPYMSICRPQQINERSSKLERIADVTDGIIIPGFDSWYPKHRRIGTQDRIYEAQTLDAWHWRVEHSENGAVRTVAHRSVEDSPVQIIHVPDCSTREELLARLQRGVNGRLVTGRVLIGYHNQYLYEGLLCFKEDLKTEGDSMTIKQNVMQLPAFEFRKSDLVNLNEVVVHRRLHLGRPQELVPILSPEQAVLRNLVKQLVWTHPEAAISSEEAQHLAQLVESVSIHDSSTLLQELYAMPKDEAEEEARRVVDCFVGFLRNTTEAGQYLKRAIMHSEDIMGRCAAINEVNWKNANSSLIEEAEMELAIVTEEIASKKALAKALEQRYTERKAELEAEYSDQENLLRDQLKELRATLNDAEDQITQTQLLEEEVTSQFQKKCEEIAENAAKYVVDMSFLPWHVWNEKYNAGSVLDSTPNAAAATEEALDQGDDGRGGLSSDSPAEPISAEISGNTDGSVYCYAAKSDEEVEELTTSEDVLDCMAEAVEVCGIAREHARNWSAFLLAAEQTRSHMLLVGPNAGALAAAVSWTLYGKGPAILECNTFSREVLAQCMEDDAPVVVLRNLINSEWMGRIEDLLQDQHKLFVATQPFAEDLIIEPRGLYSYLQPMITEPYVISTAADDMMPSVKAPALCLPSGQTSGTARQCIRSAGMAPLLRARTETLLADMQAALNTDNADRDWLFGVMPYIYLTSGAPGIEDAMHGSQLLSGRTKKMIGSWLGL